MATSTPKRASASATHIKPVPSDGRLAPADQPQPKSKYRAEEFLIPAHDEKDQSIPYSYRGGKRYAQILSKIVWSRTFPYQTPGDIQRHALDRHLKWLDSLDPGLITNDIAQLDVINGNIGQGETAVAFAESIDKLEHTVKKLVDLKLRGMAIKMVHQIRKDATGIENPLLRSMYLTEIKRRFNSLLNGEGVELTATDDSTEPGEELGEAFHKSWGYNEDSEEMHDQLQQSHGSGDE